VEEVQRTRILEAMAEMTVEWGAGAVTVSHVVARAGVSRRTFYELFADREACLLATFDLGVERARARVEPAYTAQARWRDGIRVGLATFLSFLEDEPALGRLCVVHSLGGGADVLSRRAEVLGDLSKVVDQGRTEGAAGSVQPSAVIAEGVVGAVLSVIYTRLQAAEEGSEEEPLIELFGELMNLILLPYLGPSAARRELTRPVPKVQAGTDATLAGKDRDDDPQIRLTYRTARVLTAIAEYPGASNREVAGHAGVVDQGQVSKLLGRLLRLGLIANTGDNTSRGAPNAWRLTELGERVERRAAMRSEHDSSSLSG
jgi:AcrR family transcriptional regulator/DNA-binding MarR family transcriptional regulator